LEKCPPLQIAETDLLGGFMKVSVEIPVFKHHFLNEAIESVLRQTYREWHLYLLSDGASRKAQRIMEEWRSHSSISVRFEENAGVGTSRRKLTEWSTSECILPMDDDDVLLPECLSQMVACLDAHAEAGIVRAKRVFLDRKGRKVDRAQWFPFEPRKLLYGMTCDVHNHSQPVLIRRSAYLKTEGWFGFEEFGGAGEDCDIFLKIEEVAEIVLLEMELYGYRLHRKRFSKDLGSRSAFEMWRRLADMTIRRRGLRLMRVNDTPPFEYMRI
jgi:glycosyltransferase involved in cell wall biosynthesis